MSSKAAGASDMKVESPSTKYTDEEIIATYRYQTVLVKKGASGNVVAAPHERSFCIKTQRKRPKLGVMLVGLGGNNGSTVYAGILANRLKSSWETRNGTVDANWFGSMILTSTTKLGVDENANDFFVPISSLLPMTRPEDWVVDGWDINAMPLGDAMKRAKVIDVDLRRQLYDEMNKVNPLAGIYDPDFIASNQLERADNVLKGSKKEMMEQIRRDIRNFKTKNGVDKVIVMWTANTERFAELRKGLNDTAENLMQAIERNESEIAPSTLYCMASIFEGCAYLNGSPQNTFVPGVVELAISKGVFIGGDDFKTGQTKMKSVLADFLVSAGLKIKSIVSYNHLGNNDGCNLSAPKQFRSKEISKSNVVDDMVGSNTIMYPNGEKPDHCVVIKYVPAVGDSKRAMDEYSSEIFLGGTNVMAIHNTCEDSLLASPVIIDLILVTELFQRISIRALQDDGAFEPMHSVLSVLSYFFKAPMVPAGTPVKNALFQQRECFLNVLRACLGLPAENYMLLEHKLR